MKQAIE